MGGARRPECARGRCCRGFRGKEGRREGRKVGEEGGGGFGRVALALARRLALSERVGERDRWSDRRRDGADDDDDAGADVEQGSELPAQNISLLVGS